MKNSTTKRGLRCAIYTRVSTDQGLEQDFNSLDAQREASEAYIKSQVHEGWRWSGTVMTMAAFPSRRRRPRRGDHCLLIFVRPVRRR